MHARRRGARSCGHPTPMPDVFHEMSSKRLGMTCVVDDDGRLVGVFTDGDLRRLMSRTADVLALTAGEAMTPQPDHDSPRAAGGRGAEDHGNAQDHVGGRRRRRRRRRGRGPSARPLAHADVLMPDVAFRPKPPRIRVSCSSTSTACSPTALSHARRRHRVQGLPHPRRRRDRLGAARRA